MGSNFECLHYEIEYRTGANNGNADALSRKPLAQTNLNAQTDDTTNNVLNIETIPFNVSYEEMVSETCKDRILSVVYDCLVKGRELPQSAEFLPYQRVKDHLNIDKECVLKANRVIVPVKLKDKVMQMLHSEHMGISKTKNLARFYVWWPKIDEDIEKLVKSGAYPRGGAFGARAPPLSLMPNEKNLRRLKDLRGQIQKKSQKFSK